MSKPNHREKTLLTVPEFAKKIGVNKVSVFRHIKQGFIIPVMIGMEKNLFIDYSDYRDYKFDLRRVNNTKK